MNDRVVLDVEIQKCVGQNGLAWEDTHKLGVAVAVIYEFNSDRFRIFGPNDLERLKQRLLAADEVIGFNIVRFDLPVIWEIPARQRVEMLCGKTNDLLLRIWRALGLDENKFSDLHRGWGLDVVARATLGRGKIGNGADAPKWFQQGDWARVVNYCMDDVTLERDLAVFIDRYGYVNGPRCLKIPPVQGFTLTGDFGA